MRAGSAAGMGAGVSAGTADAGFIGGGVMVVGVDVFIAGAVVVLMSGCAAAGCVAEVAFGASVVPLALSRRWAAAHVAIYGWDWSLGCACRARSLICGRLVVSLCSLPHPVAVDLVLVNRACSGTAGRDVDLAVCCLANDGLAWHAEQQVLRAPLHGGVLRKPRIQIRLVDVRRLQLLIEPLVETRVTGSHGPHRIDVAWTRPKCEPIEGMKNARIALKLG